MCTIILGNKCIVEKNIMTNESDEKIIIFPKKKKNYKK